MPFSFRAPFFSGLLAASLLVAGVRVVADDWPQFLGPNRNGIYLGPPLAKSWPAAGPRVVWRKRVGQGFAGPVVAGNRLILFHRVADKEVVEALDARTASPQWRYAYGTSFMMTSGSMTARGPFPSL